MMHVVKEHLLLDPVSKRCSPFPRHHPHTYTPMHMRNVLCAAHHAPHAEALRGGIISIVEYALSLLLFVGGADVLSGQWSRVDDG